MSAAHILAERVLTAIGLGDNTQDRLAETFDVAFNCFTLRRTLLELEKAGLLVDSRRREGAQVVWALPPAKTRRRAA